MLDAGKLAFSVHSCIMSAYTPLFLLFHLVLKPLLQPVFGPFFLQRAAEISMGWKENVHLSAGHPYQVGALNYVNFSSRVTFQLNSGGTLKRTHFPLCCVFSVTSLKQWREVWCECGWNSKDVAEDLRNAGSSFLSCSSPVHEWVCAPSYRRRTGLVVQEYFSVGNNGRQGSLKWS